MQQHPDVPILRPCNGQITGIFYLTGVAAQLTALIPIAIAAFAAASLLAVWMVFIEPRRFRVRRVRIAASDRSTSRLHVEDGRLAGLKILHVTDTHFHGREKAKLRFLRGVAEEEFDLVFFTGDLIDGQEGIDACVEAAGYFRARVGKFAVLGGHDHFRVNPLVRYVQLAGGAGAGEEYGTPNPTHLFVERLCEKGFEVLSDRHRVVELGDGQRAAIVGLRDAFLFLPDYRSAWEGIPPAIPVIVLAHSPDVLPEVCRRGTKLAFFGHTHGGQVRLPFVGALITRSHLPPRKASGTFKTKGTVYCLNNGVGAGRRLSFRLLCPPEVTVVSIHAAAPS